MLLQFALGRQSRAKASATPAGADIPAQQHVSRHAQLPADEQRSQPEAVAGAANGAAAAAPGGGGDRLPGGGAARPRLSATSSAEASSEAERMRAEIDAENRRKLAGMSAAEVGAWRARPPQQSHPNPLKLGRKASVRSAWFMQYVLGSPYNLLNAGSCA